MYHRVGFTAAQSAELWERWKKGEGLKSIGRGWMRAAAIAGAAGVPMSTHLYPEVAAQVMRITETAHWLEWQDWADPILRRPYKVKDGQMHIPDLPGTGLEWNEDAVTANRVDL
jgi:mandelate racemase